MEIRLSALRGALVSAPDALQSWLRDIYLDGVHWIARDLVLDVHGGARPRIVPVSFVRERHAHPPSLILRATATLPPHRSLADRRSAAGLLGYAVDASDGEIGRVADMTLDDATWAVRGISVRTSSGGGLMVPVLAVAALLASERRMVLRLDRKRLLRFRYPRAVEARA